MRGTVVGINPSRGLIAIQTADGDLTVAELLGGYEVEQGDEIRGNLDALGGETFYNITQNEEMDVSVEGTHCSPQNARQLMR